MSDFRAYPLTLRARPVERVWGGQRLAHAGQPIGELWAIAEESAVESGPYQGVTLRQLAERYPTELLGRAALSARFPLLIKLLDCADWLSVQVHPDDEQASRLEGAGTLGKTEAWFILAAQPGARLIAGLDETLSPEALRQAILNGQVMEHVRYAEARPGDAFMMTAGTVHALGPGLFLYEVQQSSDVTYRIYDWDRPQTAGRALHLSQSAEVSRPAQAVSFPAQARAATGSQEVLRCDYFVLESLESAGEVIEGDTAGLSFHALTVVQGEAHLETAEQQVLSPYQSVLLPASLGKYRLSGQFKALISRLPV